MSNILEVQQMNKVFSARGDQVHAVQDVTFAVPRGKTFGLVGESGSGKSTVARCALRLVTPTSGTSLIDGRDVSELRGRQLREFRAMSGMIFQNPVAALNPRLTILDSISEPLRTHTALGRNAVRTRVLDLLDEVGLSKSHASRYPHQLSGGQCQRVGIARAIATQPKLLVLDEPTSALDVSVQAQVLNLLQQLKHEHQLSYLLITHDLDVVRYMSDFAGVMRQGRMVEQGPAREVLISPSEEYTKQLLGAMPETPGAVSFSQGQRAAVPADGLPSDGLPRNNAARQMDGMDL